MAKKVSKTCSAAGHELKSNKVGKKTKAKAGHVLSSVCKPTSKKK